MEPRAKIVFEDVATDLFRVLEQARVLLTILERGPGAREAALALTKLQEATHWLDECGAIAG